MTYKAVEDIGKKFWTEGSDELGWSAHSAYEPYNPMPLSEEGD
jgi:hypothetical protein